MVNSLPGLNSCCGWLSTRVVVVQHNQLLAYIYFVRSCDNRMGYINEVVVVGLLMGNYHENMYILIGV